MYQEKDGCLVPVVPWYFQKSLLQDSLPTDAALPVAVARAAYFHSETEHRISLFAPPKYTVGSRPITAVQFPFDSTPSRTYRHTHAHDVVTRKTRGANARNSMLRLGM